MEEFKRLATAGDTTAKTLLKVILRNEVAYRKHTSVQDQKARPHLYRLNQISATELKINLHLILTYEG